MPLKRVVRWYWTTIMREDIRRMSDNHVVNTMAMLQRRLDAMHLDRAVEQRQTQHQRDWIARFRRELKRRADRGVTVPEEDVMSPLRRWRIASALHPW